MDNRLDLVSPNFTHISITSTPDTTSQATSGRLQNVIAHCLMQDNQQITPNACIREKGNYPVMTGACRDRNRKVQHVFVVFALTRVVLITFFSLLVMLVILTNCVFMAINREVPHSESVQFAFFLFKHFYFIFILL